MYHDSPESFFVFLKREIGVFSFLYVVEKYMTAVIANVVKQSGKIDAKEFQSHYPQQIDLNDLSLKFFFS